MKKERKCDSRVARTKAAIRRAYLKLLGQREGGTITVTDIAEAADVDRKTVYNYYEGVTAIRDELEDELVRLVAKAIGEADLERCPRDPLGFLQAVTNAFAAHDELTVPLVRKSKHSQVLQKLGDAFAARVSALLKKHVSPSKLVYTKLYADFITGGTLTLYRDWLNAGMQQPLEEIAKQLELFLKTGIAAFMA